MGNKRIGRAEEGRRKGEIGRDEEILHKRGRLALMGRGIWENIYHEGTWPKRGRPNFKEVGL